MLKALRSDKAVILWTVVRIYLGWKWLEAGWRKLGTSFDASGFLREAIGKATGEHPAVQSWYASFLDHIALPNVGLFNFLVVWGEILVGLGLILGACTTVALVAGMFMNLNYLLAGTTSTNPILYTLAIILLAIGPTVYRYGVDYFLKSMFKENFKEN